MLGILFNFCWNNNMESYNASKNDSNLKTQSYILMKKGLKQKILKRKLSTVIFLIIQIFYRIL